MPQNVLNGTTFCLTLRQDGEGPHHRGREGHPAAPPCPAAACTQCLMLAPSSYALCRAAAGPCNVSTLLGITSPFNRPRRLLQVALYDRKVDNYECCPTFNFRL